MKFLNYFPTVFVLIAIIWLSLADMHTSEGLSFPYMDKAVHFCMYGGLVSVLYFDLSRCYSVLPRRLNLFVFTWLLPVLFGGLMELFQKFLTDTRSAEWSDFFANTAGTTAGLFTGIYIVFPLVKKLRKH